MYIIDDLWQSGSVGGYLSYIAAEEEDGDAADAYEEDAGEPLVQARASACCLMIIIE